MKNINSWKKIEIDYSDKNLFGNDAAEEEKEEIFFSYALEPEILYHSPLKIKTENRNC